MKHLEIISKKIGLSFEMISYTELVADLDKQKTVLSDNVNDPFGEQT